MILENASRGDSCRRERRAGAAAAIEREEASGAIRRGDGPRRRCGGDDATLGAPASGGDFLDGNAEGFRLVDEVVRDARTRERDHALGE